MQIPKKLNNVIDFLGIIIPLIVDLVLNVVSFSILAPDTLSRIAFIALAIMIVVFVPRAWSKRQFISYAIFVSVVVFADWSFTLATTGETIRGSNTVITQDVELERLRENLNATERKIENLHQQYYEANKRETLKELNNQIQFEQKRLEKLENDYNLRLNKTETEAKKNQLSADDIFSAIPNAWKGKRYIPLVVWFLVFLGVQLVVATSIDIGSVATPSAAVSNKEVKLPKGVTVEDVKSWVHGSFYHVTNQGSNMILSMENFFKLLPNFDMKKYQAIGSVAVKKGVIDRYGHVFVVDEEKAVNQIIS